MDKIQIIRTEGQNIIPDQKTVFALFHCEENSPAYKSMCKEYEKLLPRVQERLRPAAALVTGTIPEGMKAGVLKAGTRVLYTIITVGKPVSDYSQYYFRRGDYVKGMVIDAMADGCLFQYEEEVLQKVREICEAEKIGVSHRYEAPQEIPMQMQKAAFDALQADKSLGLSITSGFMYDPVKSTCQIFELSERADIFRLEHDCSLCEKWDCSMRRETKVTITVEKQEAGRQPVKTESFQISTLQTILQGLLEHHVYINAVCGGNGRCRKCRIKVLEGNVPVTAEDRKAYRTEELSDGMRLACRAHAFSDCTIMICGEDESDFHAVGSLSRPEISENISAYGIAIDIGTTTLALSMISLSDGKILDTYTAMNRQRTFGADVISRILAATDGKEIQLQNSIRMDLLNGITTLILRNGVQDADVHKIAIAGNTTMLHLLMGYSCEGLGVYPFKPVTLQLEQRNFREVFEEIKAGDTEPVKWQYTRNGPVKVQVNRDEKSSSELLIEGFSHAQVYLLPGNSTYVGADIMSGLYACEFFRKEEISVLIDLGTNGEMAIGNKDRILVTSTAAGPAFEGGNIKWGVGSIAGAISQVQIRDGKAEVHTIDNRPAVGICGTGVIETTAELVNNGLVDEAGVLEETYFENGFPLAKTINGEMITFTQKDVREIQLAKSAIRAGLETLLLRYGVTYEQIDKVYLAGGFGFFLDIQKAVEIGMLPKQLQEKTVAAGNTSLDGAISFLAHERQANEILPKIAELGEEIQLSTDPQFNDFYMKYMMFEEE